MVLEMKVVHLISNLEIGGAQRVRLELIRKFIEMGCKPENHILAYFHDGPMRKKFENIGIRTKKLVDGLLKYSPSAVFSINRLIEAEKPDIIHSQLWVSNFFARIACSNQKIPVICDLHCMPSVQGFFRNILDRIVPFKASRYVAVSEGIGRAFKYLGAARLVNNSRPEVGSISVIQNGVDSTKFRFSFADRDFLRKDLGIDKKTFVVGAVGRIETVKSFDHLIRAFKKFHDICVSKRFFNQASDVKLVIVGFGQEEQAMRQLVANLGLKRNVIFRSTTHGMYKFYSIFDCLAITSRSEGLSVAMLEALFSGLPIVTTGDSNGEHEVIKDGLNGFVFDYGNETAMVEKLLKIFHEFNPDFTQRPSLIDSHFDIGRVAKEYRNLYREVIEAKLQ